MNKVLPGFFVLGALIHFAPSTAQAANRIVVADFESSKALVHLARQVTDEVLLAVDAGPEHQAIGRAELDLLLRHEEDLSSLGDCEAGRSACLAKIAEAAKAQGFLSGRVALWGTSHVITLAYNHDDVIARDSCIAQEYAELKTCLKTAVRDLLEINGDKPTPRVPVAEGPTKIAVLDLEAHSEDLQNASKDVTQLFALELKRFEGVSVISRAEIEVMLDYALTRAECTGEDLSCLVEIGGALGVDYLAHGAIGHLGNTYVIHLKLLDIQNASVKRRVSEEFVGELSELRRAIRFAATSLMGRQLIGQGSLSIEGAPAQSTVSIDGQAHDLKAARALLTVGKHHLRIEADGYQSRALDLYIEPERLTTVQAHLQDATLRWYEQWWTWAIAGTVAAAAGITSVALLTSGGPTQGRIDVEVP